MQAVASRPVMGEEEARQWSEAWVDRWSDLAQEIVLDHPFMRKVQRGEASRDAVRRFMEHWFQWARTVSMSGAGLYYRHLPVFKRYPDLDAHVLERIGLEMIRPVKGGPPRALEAIFPALGVPFHREQPTALIAEMRGFIGFVRRLHLESTFAEMHAVQLGPTMPAFARIWLEALTTHYRVPPDAALYWQHYATMDESSAKGGILGTRSEVVLVLQRIKELGLVDERPGWGMEYVAEMSLRLWELFLKGCDRRF